MAVLLAPGNSKGPLVDPGLCRCCRSIKKCRLLSAQYESTGEKEIYSEMFMDCFGLLLSNIDGDSKDCCICATCVTRLREACAFKKQVLQCEQALLDLMHSKLEDRKCDVEVKMELPAEYDAPCDGESCHSPGGTDTDYEPEKNIKVKLKTEKKTRKRKSIKTSMRKQLLGDIRTLRHKLDAMVDQPKDDITASEKPDVKPKTVPTAKRKKGDVDVDDMIFKNTVTIVHNSYICPFVTRISMYYCYYCKDQFTNPSELRDHTLTHDPTTRFEDMIEYNKMPKMDVTRVDCRLCAEKIETIDNFKTHITNVHGKTLYPVENEFIKFKLTMNNLKCTECDSTFPYIDLLVKHMIVHFGTYVCDMCGACFIELASLRSHINNHSKVDRNYPCEICGKNLKSKYSRILHVATVHEKKATVNCYKCEATFMSYALRTKHLIEVHGDKRTFPCKFCDKVYNRRKTLGEHNRRNHLKVFRHKCDLCDQKFYLPSRLKEHMATHTGERNFRCEFCDKSYPRLQSLQEHLRSHSSERRFKCDMCGSAFTHNGSLKIHMKSHHQYDLDTSFN